MDKEESHKRGININRILGELKPKEDKTDRRILFELTGIRLFDGDFEDESTPEEDLERLIDNLVGYDDLDDEQDEETES